MGRIRTIKPAFFTNDEVGECSPMARLTFIGLWTLADRQGRLEDRPLKILVELFPYEPETNIVACLDELCACGVIVRYEANGIKVIQIVNFVKHQRPHPKEPPSELPGLGKDGKLVYTDKPPGGVYLIRSGENGPVKIGFAKHIAIRLSELQVANPNLLTVVGWIDCDSSYERQLHIRFADARMAGEWFTMTPELSEFIKSECRPWKNTAKNVRASKQVRSSRRKEISSKEISSKEILDSCSEPALPASEPSASTEVVVLDFPTHGEKKSWPLTETKIAEYAETFPGVNVFLECRKALQWCRDNPTKRKTYAGMAKFLGGWLGRVQDRGGGKHGQQAGDKFSGIKTWLESNGEV